MFDGTAWVSLDAQLRGYLATLFSWDADGPGPAPQELVLSGTMTSGDSTFSAARWDGASWQSLGGGVAVTEFTQWDPDGPGPIGTLLVGAGSIPTGDGTGKVAMWDGNAWNLLGDLGWAGPRSITTWDADGEGPVPATLAVVVRDITITTNRAFVLSQNEWISVGGTQHEPLCVRSWDADGAGPNPPELFVGGSFDYFGSSTSRDVARWNGAFWRPLGGGVPDGRAFGRGIDAMVVWDRDDGGPLPAVLVAAGDFPTLRNEPSGEVFGVDNVAVWDGTAWWPLDYSGLAGEDPLSYPAPHSVNELMPWDPDGSGPAPEVLMVGGNFASAAGQESAGLAQWNGNGWQPVSGAIGQTWCMASWSPYGDFIPPYLVAGGSFSTTSGTATYGAKFLDGANWYPMGTAARRLSDVTVFTSSLPNMLHDEVIACGYFFDGASSYSIGVWTGLTWLPVGGAFTTQPVSCLLVWDADGAGSSPVRLIAGGAFSSIGGTPANNIAAWDGATWIPLAGGTDGPVAALTTWDPDGHGPLRPHLVAGGNFTHAGAVTTNDVGMWNGAGWQALGGGVPNGAAQTTVTSLSELDPDSTGPMFAHLVAAHADGIGTSGLWKWDGASWQQMQGEINEPVAVMRAWKAPGAPAAMRQLVLGGSFTRIGNMPAAYMATWRIEGACPTCDSIDFNGDGLFPDTQDIADFLTVFGGGACPTGTCGDIDFNNDGLFPDTDDIGALIRVFGGGPCT